MDGILASIIRDSTPDEGALYQRRGILESILRNNPALNTAYGALSNPLPMEGRLSLLPAIVNNGQRELALPGILASAWNAFTAPRRAYTGNLGDPVEEAMNFAGMMQMGAMPAPVSGGPGTLGLNVWHGSQHKFDKFDASKIGTGEGAQAYGHGLYFAENPSVAKSYAPVTPSKLKIGEQVFAKGDNPAADLVMSMAKDGTRDVTKALNEAFRSAELNYPKEQAQSIKMQIAGWLSENARMVKEKGVLYKADLPDSMIPKMLDWDKPLSQQSAEVRKALDAAGINANGLLYGQGDLKGSALMHILAEGHGPAKASERLNSLGIPGIRYLDQGSRAGGQGTYNYVVFPGMEKDIKILERK